MKTLSINDWPLEPFVVVIVMKYRFPCLGSDVWIKSWTGSYFCSEVEVDIGSGRIILVSF
jgi:hypothetical protein